MATLLAEYGQWLYSARIGYAVSTEVSYEDG